MTYIKLSDAVPEEGDVAVFVRNGGMRAIAYQRQGDKVVEMPLKWESRFYGVDETLIGTTIHAGWTRKEWKVIHTWPKSSA